MCLDTDIHASLVEKDYRILGLRLYQVLLNRSSTATLLVFECS